MKENGLNKENILSIFIPNSYDVYWNVEPNQIRDKMFSEYQKFWNDNRIQKANKIGLSKLEVTSLASIVQKESVKIDERPTIAGVYINRLNKRMRLQADPTVIYSIKDYYKNGLTLVVASSASMFTINNVMERFHLNPYFKDKLSGADLKASKPHPEVFTKAAKAAGYLPSECIVIEDSTNGIIAAKNANIYCIAYKSEHSKDQDYSRADQLVSDYTSITFDKIKAILN